MGKLERKIQRAIMHGLTSLVIGILLYLLKFLKWIFLVPFKLLKWTFLSRGPAKHINSRGYVVLTDINELEHRYIARQSLGRNLYGNEIVHHINGRKTDNALNNLCLMDGQKHEHFHSWLRWKKEKSGKYPTISHQKRVLQDEYGGTLLESVIPPKPTPLTPKFQKQESVESKEQEALEVETFPARRNKVSQKLFLEFEEEILISPEGKLVEIDDKRFEASEEVIQSELTEKQIEIYNNKLKTYESNVTSSKTEPSFQKQLFFELKKERLKIARENKVPAYIIFHDTTLIEMAQVMPVSEMLMLQIHGVGPEKMKKYGDRFINVIKVFKSNSKIESAS